MKLISRSNKAEVAKHWLAGFSCLILLIVGTNARADTMAAPIDQQLPIFMNILSRDRNLGKVLKNMVNVGVVFNSADPSSVQAKDEILAFKKKYPSLTLRGLPISYVPIEFKSAQDLENMARKWWINVFYIAPGNGANLEDIRRVSEDLDIITMTGVTEYRQRGVTVGLTNELGRAKPVINLPASKSLGIQFDPKLTKNSKLLH